MITGKHKLLNPDQHEQLRKEIITYRRGAISVAFSELDGLLNVSALQRQYFEDKSVPWINQKIKGTMVGGKQRSFNEEEARQLAAAFRDIATRLNILAGEIEAVANID